MLDHVGQGLFGNATRRQPHLLWNQPAIGPLLSHELFIQFHLNGQDGFKLVSQGLQGWDKPLTQDGRVEPMANGAYVAVQQLSQFLAQVSKFGGQLPWRGGALQFC